MAMTADDILVHPAFEPCVRGQAQSLLLIQEASPRIASLFATQQRRLMPHAALAQYFRNEANEAGTGVLAERFLELVECHGLASRNTATAFLKEMLKYDMVRFVANSEGRRHRSIEPAHGRHTAGDAAPAWFCDWRMRSLVLPSLWYCARDARRSAAAFSFRRAGVAVFPAAPSFGDLPKAIQTCLIPNEKSTGAKVPGPLPARET